LLGGIGVFQQHVTMTRLGVDFAPAANEVKTAQFFTHIRKANPYHFFVRSAGPK